MKVANQLEQDLIGAAGRGDLAAVKEALDKGANIHTDKDYPLERAADNGHLDVVKFLVEKGASVHGEDDFPLLWAAEKNHLEIAEFLLSHGANLSTYDHLPLRRAAELGHLAMVALLVEKGADIYAHEFDAIIKADKHGHDAVFAFLAEKGRWHEKNEYGLTPLVALKKAEKTAALAERLEKFFVEKAMQIKKAEDEKLSLERMQNEARVAALKEVAKPFRLRGRAR
jgi:ankyrin repeat protein